MIYSIGNLVDFEKLHWQSDWDSKDIFGEDYPHDFVVGLYSEPNGEVSYYIDLRTNTVITIFLEDEEEEDVETIWDEGYFV